MNGPEHYQEAERLLSEAAAFDADENQTTVDVLKLTAAQVHATLALAAATATHPGGTDPNTNLSANEAAWAEVAEVKPS